MLHAFHGRPLNRPKLVSRRGYWVRTMNVNGVEGALHRPFLVQA